MSGSDRTPSVTPQLELWTDVCSQDSRVVVIDLLGQFHGSYLTFSELLRREFRLYCQYLLFRVLMAHPHIQDARQSISVVNDSLLDRDREHAEPGGG